MNPATLTAVCSDAEPPPAASATESTDDARSRKGDPVPVVYPPGEPGKARLADSRHLDGPHVVLLVLFLTPAVLIFGFLILLRFDAGP